MLLDYAVGLLAAGSLLFAVGYRVFRQPEPPQWLRDGVAGDLFTVAVIGFLVLGAGLLIKFGVTLPDQAIGWPEVLLALTIALVAAFLIRRILMSKVSVAHHVMATDVSSADHGKVVSLDPTAAASDTPGPRGTPIGGGKKRRKRAA